MFLETMLFSVLKNFLGRYATPVLVGGGVLLVALSGAYFKGMAFGYEKANAKALMQITKLKEENNRVYEDNINLENVLTEIQLKAKKASLEHEQEVQNIREKVTSLDIPSDLTELRRLCNIDPNCNKDKKS